MQSSLASQCFAEQPKSKSNTPQGGQVTQVHRLVLEVAAQSLIIRRQLVARRHNIWLKILWMLQINLCLLTFLASNLLSLQHGMISASSTRADTKSVPLRAILT